MKNLKKLSPELQYAGLQKNDVLVCIKPFPIGKRVPKEHFIDVGKLCFWETECYGNLSIRFLENGYNNKYEISKGSGFEELAEHFQVDESFKFADVAKITETSFKNSTKHYTQSAQNESGLNVEIKPHYHYADDGSIYGVLDLNYTWRSSNEDKSKISYKKNVAVKVTNPLITKVDINVSAVTDRFEFHGLNSIEKLEIDLDGYNPVPCKLNNIEELKSLDVSCAHLESVTITEGLLLELRRCKVDELIINSLKHDTKRSSNPIKIVNTHIGNVSTPTHFRRAKRIVESDSYSTVQNTIELIYDTHAECGLIISSNDESKFYSKHELTKLLMIMQWNDTAIELGLDISVDNTIFSKIGKPGWSKFIYETADQCSSKNSCAEYKIAPILKAVKIVEGSVNFNDSEYSLFYDGQNYHTLTSNDLVTSISVSFEKPISKEVYQMLFDRFERVYGEDFMKKHMFLHVKQPGTLFDIMSLLDTDYPFANDFKFKVNVSAIDFGLLPDTVTAIVNDNNVVKIVEGPVVKERFGGFKLIEGSKMNKPEEYEPLKNLILYWDLFDSYYPPTIRLRN